MKPILLAAFMTFAAVAKATVACADEPSPRLDLYGDPLPPGALARLGTVRFRIGDRGIKKLAMSADGRFIAAAGNTRSIVLWDAESGKPLKTIDVSPRQLVGMALSPDGAKLAVASRDAPVGARLHIHHVGMSGAMEGGMGGAIDELPTTFSHHELGLAFSADGDKLVSCDLSGTLRVQEIDGEGDLLRDKFPGRAFRSPTASADGAVVAAFVDRTLVAWDWASGNPPHLFAAFDGGHSHGVAIAFSPDGVSLATASHELTPSLCIWKTASGEFTKRLSAPAKIRDFGYSLAWSPDSKWVAAPVVPVDDFRWNVVGLWNAASGELQTSLECPGGGQLVSAPHANRLASSCGSSVRLWDWESREVVGAIDDSHTESVELLATTPSGQIVTSGDDGAIRVWDGATGRQTAIMRHDNLCRGMAVSPDGSLVASSSLDDTVRLWELATGREIYRLPGHGRLGGMRPLIFAPDGDSFTSFGDDLVMRTWDCSTGKALREVELRPKDVALADDEAKQNFSLIFEVQADVFSPDASRLFTSFRQDHLFAATAAMVDAGAELRRDERPESFLRAAAISPDNRRLLASWYGHTTTSAIQLRDLETGALLRNVEYPLHATGPVAFSPDGDRYAFAIGLPKHEIIVCRTDDGTEIQRFEDVPCTARSLCFSRDGKKLISGMVDSTALVWELK